jgi:hypothetical protein
VRYHSWRRSYSDRAETIIADEPNITREALAEEMDLPLDFVDELLEQIRPTRTSPKPVMQHRVGSFK